MSQHERRKDSTSLSATALRRLLNEDQLLTLSELERFGWELKFVRSPVFLDPQPVVFDADRKGYAIIRSDGTLDEKPAIKLRTGGMIDKQPAFKSESPPEPLSAPPPSPST